MIGRSGRVFADRYFLRELRTPSEVKIALAYVLTNESKHRGIGPPWLIRITPFSSALKFSKWDQLLGKGGYTIEYTHWYEGFIFEWYQRWMRDPGTWLLRTGWMRARPRSGAHKTS